MAFVADIRKTVTDTTPVFAAVGLADLAVEKVRAAYQEFDSKALMTEVQNRTQAEIDACADDAFAKVMVLLKS